jgi:hypothetical protein
MHLIQWFYLFTSGLFLFPKQGSSFAEQAFCVLDIGIIAQQAVDLSRNRGGQFLLEEIDDNFNYGLGGSSRNVGLIYDQIY